MVKTICRGEDPQGKRCGKMRIKLGKMDNVAHAGLIIDKYTNRDVTPKKNIDFGVWGDALTAVDGCKELYEKFIQKYNEEFLLSKTATPGMKLETFNMRTKSRVIIGLGIASAMETGLALHCTYGVPYIPGSALKGLAAHYCHKVLGVDHNNDDYKMGAWDNKRDVQTTRNGKFYEVLFGNIGDDDNDAAAGFITFHDAFICPNDLASSLKLDIITPHHPDYYNGGKAAPTDFDDPSPISFLSVGEGKCFQFHLTCSDTSNNGVKWLAIAKKILVKALTSWGVGGKTSTGYGRMAL